MPTASSTNQAPTARPPTTVAATSNAGSLTAASETSPLLRARYSTGYNEPVPPMNALSSGGTSPTAGTSSWTRYINSATAPNAAAQHEPTSEMPALMSFISLLPPPREMTYGSMERVLPAGLSPSANVGASASTPAAGGANNSARKTSFLLSALLWLYIHPIAISAPRDAQGAPSPTGTWDIWRRMEDELKGRRVLLALIKRVWGAFAENGAGRGGGTVEEVLWSEIPLEEGRTETIRVMDLATVDDGPTWFLSHPLVMISIRSTWSHGIPKPATRESTWVAFDRFSTPRITHAIFLIHHLIYLSVLSHLVLSPPSNIYLTPFQVPSYREYYLFLYSLSAFPYDKRPTLSILPYIFVALALAFAYPGIPTPNTNTHALLLLALSCFLLQIHLPNPDYIPTPLFLFEPKRVLPLATLVKGLIKQAVRPGVFFFGPVVILVGMFLAQALGDSFPLIDMPVTAASKLLDWMSGHVGSNESDQIPIGSPEDGPCLSRTTTTSPSHPQTRITLLLLFLSSLGAMWTLVNCLVMLFPGSVSSRGVLQSRDEYEDYPTELKSEPENSTATLGPSTSAVGGKNGGEGWRLQPTRTSAIVEDRASRSIPNFSGFVGGGPWERYGPSTAMSAKRSFASAVRRYQHLRLVSTPLSPTTEGPSTSADGTQLAVRKPCGRVVLPPLFNLLSWLLGTVPATVLRLTTRDPSSLQGVSEDGGAEAGHAGRFPSSTQEEEDDNSLYSPALGREYGGESGRMRRWWRRARLNKRAERWEGLVRRVVWRLAVGLPGLVVGGVWTGK